MPPLPIVEPKLKRPNPLTERERKALEMYDGGLSPWHIRKLFGYTCLESAFDKRSLDTLGMSD